MNEVIFQEDTHQYFLDGKEYPSVTTILKHFGMSDYSMVGETTLMKAATFGTNFHKTASFYEEGTLGEYSPEFEPWLNGWKKFLKDMAPVSLAIELPMVSKAWGFSGTPDRIYTIRDKAGIWDIKTGTEVPANELQTAGYQILAEENLGIKIKERGTVYVFADGYKLHHHNAKTDDGVFKGLINGYKWKKLKGLL